MKNVKSTAGIANNHLKIATGTTNDHL